MSYNDDKIRTTTYSDVNSLVNTTGDYNTLGNYYNKPSCPPNSTPGTCSVQPFTITPGFGGVGYSLPGFNTASNGVSTSENDNNYFSLNTAYPQSCKMPLFSSTYNSSS